MPIRRKHKHKRTTAKKVVQPVVACDRIIGEMKLMILEHLSDAQTLTITPACHSDSYNAAVESLLAEQRIRLVGRVTYAINR